MLAIRKTDETGSCKKRLGFSASYASPTTALGYEFLIFSIKLLRSELKKFIFSSEAFSKNNLRSTPSIFSADL
jgi:hypothetical protein